MKRFILLIGLLALLVTSYTHAATGVVQGNVDRTLVAGDGRWGGCMVYLDVKINTVLPSCPSNWVSFSCTGNFTTKDAANRMFDSAMMAKALGKSVKVIVDDTKKHNGYCYAWRVDVL